MLNIVIINITAINIIFMAINNYFKDILKAINYYKKIYIIITYHIDFIYEANF